MKPLRSRLSWTVVLSLICCVLVVLVYNEITSLSSAHPAQEAPRDRVARRAATPPAATKFTMPPAEAFAEVLARPLFSANRRPAVETSESVRSAAASFTFVGTIISRQGRYALLLEGHDTRPQRVTEGQQIGGWTVDRILQDRIVLRNASSREEIKPKDTPPPADSIAPPPSPTIKRSASR